VGKRALIKPRLSLFVSLDNNSKFPIRLEDLKISRSSNTSRSSANSQINPEVSHSNYPIFFCLALFKPTDIVVVGKSARCVNDVISVPGYSIRTNQSIICPIYVIGATSFFREANSLLTNLPLSQQNRG